MKKLISVLLAILMLFTVATTVFATGDEPVDPNPSSETGGTNQDDPADPAGSSDPADPAEGEESGSLLDSIEDVPFWKVKVGLKVGKILAKLAKAFLKVAMAFGIIQKADVFKMIKDLF